MENANETLKCAKEVIDNIEKKRDEFNDNDFDNIEESFIKLIQPIDGMLQKRHEYKLILLTRINELNEARKKLEEEEARNNKKIEDLDAKKSNLKLLIEGDRKKSWGDQSSEEEVKPEKKSFAQVVSLSDDNETKKSSVPRQILARTAIPQYFKVDNFEIRYHNDSDNVAGRVYLQGNIPYFNIPIEIRKNGVETTINVKILLVEAIDGKSKTGNETYKMVDCEYGDNCTRVGNSCTFYHHGRDPQKQYNPNLLLKFMKGSHILSPNNVESIASASTGMIFRRYIRWYISQYVESA
jgi:hypothetical protein